MKPKLKRRKNNDQNSYQGVLKRQKINKIAINEREYRKTIKSSTSVCYVSSTVLSPKHTHDFFFFFFAF